MMEESKEVASQDDKEAFMTATVSVIQTREIRATSLPTALDSSNAVSR